MTSRSLHDPTIGLPAEMLASIFQFSIHSRGDRLGHYFKPDTQLLAISMPLKLGAICRRWRKVAWSTPFLWTTLSISPNFCRGLDDILLIEEWILRSKVLPLDITLNIPSFGKALPKFEDCETYLIGIIARTAHRWRILDINMPLDLMIQFFEMAGALPNIQALGLGDYHRKFMSVRNFSLWSEDAKPAPRHLCLHSENSLRMVNIVWQSITTLEAHSFSTSQCYGVLRDSPNLEFCMFTGVLELGGWEDLGPIIVLENLLRFTYQTRDTIENSHLFSFITTPKLTYLNYSAFKGSLGNSFLDFIWRSSPPLIHLCILKTCIHYDELGDLLRAVPSITRLQLFPQLLKEELEDEAFSAIPLLQKLAQSSSPDFLYNDTKPFLPYLQFLDYRLCHDNTFPWSHVPAVFGPPSALLSPTRRPLKSLTVLQYSHVPTTDKILNAIPKGILPSLLELQQAGARITYTYHHDLPTELVAASMKLHNVTV